MFDEQITSLLDNWQAAQVAPRKRYERISPPAKVEVKGEKDAR